MSNKNFIITLPTFQELAEKKCFEIRHISVPLLPQEDFSKVIRPFEFSELYGGSLNSIVFYNSFYLYPRTSKICPTQK